jgi:hypothetical protein
MKTTTIFIVLYVLFPLLLITINYLHNKRRRFGNRDFPDWLRIMSLPIAETKLKPWHPALSCVESNYEPVVHRLDEGWW